MIAIVMVPDRIVVVVVAFQRESEMGGLLAVSRASNNA